MFWISDPLLDWDLSLNFKEPGINDFGAFLLMPPLRFTIFIYFGSIVAGGVTEKRVGVWERGKPIEKKETNKLTNKKKNEKLNLYECRDERTEIKLLLN